MNYKKILSTLSIAITVTVSANTYGYSANDGANDHFNRKHSIDRHQYGLVTTSSCVRTPFQHPSIPGFDPETKQLTIDAEAVKTVGTATMKFGRDGSVELKNGVLTEFSLTNTSAGDTPVLPPSEVSCEGNYDLEGKNQLSMTLTCSVKSSQPGVSIVLKPLEFQGYISHKAQTISLADVPGKIQTVSVLVNDTVVQKRERLCVMTGALTKIHKSHHSDF